jgi:SRSO17 transposase
MGPVRRYKRGIIRTRDIMIELNPPRAMAAAATFRTDAARRGHALIDRALYLPRSWTDDPDRCAAARVPAGVEFATKPAPATAMITRAAQAGVSARWVAGDEVYGADPTLRDRA